METVLDKITDIFHHHKRFSSVQKLCILAVILGGVSLFTGLWTWLVTYIITLSFSVLVCQYLITSEANFTFAEDLLVLLKSHENDPWYTSLIELVRDPNQESGGNRVQDQSNVSHKAKPSSWEEEVHLLATLVSQDFIRPWYLTVSNRQDLLEEKEEIISEAFRLLCVRFSEIDIHDLCRELLLSYKDHLRNFQQAKSVYKTQPRRKSVSALDSLSAKKVSSIEEAYEIKFTYHSAVWETENEIIYLKSVVNLLLSRYLTTHLQDSKTPLVLLVEILTYNVAKPVFDLLSNPDFLHECIVHILSDETLIEVPTEIEPSQNNDIVQFQDIREEESDEEEEFKDPQPEDFCLFRTSLSQQSSHKTQHEEQQETDENPLSTRHVEAQVVMDEDTSSDKISYQTVPITLLEPAVYHNTEESQESYESIDSKDNSQEGQRFHLGSFDDISLSGEHSSKTFLDICITDTETATENRGASQYTLYTIQYDAVFEELGTSKKRTNTVKRRFREFINLQNRLEDNPVYKKSLKDVKGLTKWLSLPFGNMDKGSIEKRKKTLESFLKALLEKDNICNSLELKEFLAYDGNAHIAFVRKAPDNVQPLTKMVRTVSSVFDKIGDKVGEISTNMTDLLPSLPRRGPVRDIHSCEVDEDQIILEFGTIKGDMLFMENQLSSHVSHHSTLTDEIKLPENDSQKSKGALNELHNTGLVEVVFDVAVQALQGRNCRLCRERVVSLAKHMLGTAINRWLRWNISDLTTPQRCALYLHLFRESIWPDGKYDSSSRQVKSEKQKKATKDQARRVLADFFPDVVVQLIEKEDYAFGIEEIMDSIQYEKLNKHFIYTFLDILLEKLFSEIHLEALQKEVQ